MYVKYEKPRLQVTDQLVTIKKKKKKNDDRFIM